jgi:hypothetical protein
MVARFARISSLALLVPFALIGCSSDVDDDNNNPSSQEAAATASSLTVSSCSAELSGKEAAFKAANKTYGTTLPRDGKWFCGQAGENLTVGLYLRVAPAGAAGATNGDKKIVIQERTSTDVTLEGNLDAASIVYAQIGGGSYSPFGKWTVGDLRKAKQCTVKIVGNWQGDAATGGYDKHVEFTCS